jgi:hypothetical protein
VVVSIDLAGTCNVLSAGSAVASPCIGKSLRSQRDENLEQPVISGVAEARALESSKDTVFVG